MAKSLGATYTLKVSGNPQDIARVIHKTMGAHPRISLECSGAESSLQTAVYVSRVVEGGGGGAVRMRLRERERAGEGERDEREAWGREDKSGREREGEREG